MRIVRSAAELKDALASAEREALSAFGDGSLLLEQYVETARHIEFQILADAHGRTLHLFERECSLQRKYQKVWEESPSPVLTPEQRERMGAHAVQLAQAVGYTNAGTIEYILDPAGNYFFLEMNTRLQVEHPVTEMVTGLDLVEWQLRIAEGQPLPFTQESLEQKGYAVEVRLNAEDAAQGFLPQTGTLQLVRTLRETAGVRWELGVEAHSEVSPWYDSMLGKLIVHAANRSEALRKLKHQLAHLALLGLRTNREFLLACVQNVDVQAGNYHTRWIEQQLPTLSIGQADKVSAALLVLTHLLDTLAPSSGLLHSLPRGWRNNGVAEETETLWIDGEPITLQYTQAGSEAQVRVGESSYTLRNWQIELVESEVAAIHVECDRRVLSGLLTTDAESEWVQPDGGAIAVYRVQDRLPAPASQLAEGDYTAPMPGQIVRVVGQPGQEVNEGDPLVILSSMKMEQTVYARQAGTLREVFVTEGQFVQSGTLLVQLA
jgi:3-methylcrotonyl-CoA carboxylase alpha subunit